MRRFLGAVAMGVLAACPTTRIVGTEPASGTCTPRACGATIGVSTSLAVGTALTAAECASVCAPVWCQYKPIGNPPGCTLTSATTVACEATVFDCGYCFGQCVNVPGACGDGCCNTGTGCCQAASAPHCRGQSCSECGPPDPRCSVPGCGAFKACGGGLAAEPLVGACADADGGIDPSVDLASYCPDACNALEAGALVEAGCVDGGAGASDAGSCIAACHSARGRCEQSCPRSSFRECMDCSARCGIDLAHCLRKCR